MKYQSILIVTYGRSGSTLLQGLLNTIEGCLIRGENENYCFYLYQGYKAIRHAKAHVVPMEIMETPRSPWYGNRLLDDQLYVERTASLVREMILADRVNDKGIKCYGFKEIRYANTAVQEEFDEYLGFLEEIFPRVAFIFNTRNLVDVLRSGWWAQHDPREMRKLLENIERKFCDYAERHENTFRITYEDLVTDVRRVKDLFDFLGAEYRAENVNNVLSLQHSC